MHDYDLIPSLPAPSQHGLGPAQPNNSISAPGGLRTPTSSGLSDSEFKSIHFQKYQHHHHQLEGAQALLRTRSLSRHQARILLVNLLPRGLFCFRQIFSLRNLRLLHPYPTLAPSLPASGRYAYSLTHGSSPWPTPHRLAARITPPTRPAPRGPRSPLRDSLSPPTGQGPCTPPGFFACFCTPLLPRPGLVPGLPTRTD